MKAFLILEDGTVFEGVHIGADREIISEIVFNTSMAGYLEVLTDPSYAGQAVCMTYPLIGNYGICKDDMESKNLGRMDLLLGNCRAITAISEQIILFGSFWRRTVYRVLRILTQGH